MAIAFAGGDRDCSSAVISAYKAAGLNVNATYTGDMRAGFLATGLFEVWDTNSTTAQRGDIYLNETSHTAMCVDSGSGSYGYDALAEFSINEFGGITGGAVGDQTGSESSIHGYYDFPWDCTLHCTDSELADKAARVMEHLCTCPNHGYTQGSGRWGDGTTEYIDGESGLSGGTTNTGGAVSGEVRYRVRTGGAWLSEMCNRTDTGESGDNFAGVLGQPIEYIAINMNGWYQVQTQNGGWLDKVYNYDINDLNNGCAGDGSPIVAVRCYYETPDANATGWQAIYYAVHTTGGGWLSEMKDTTDTGGSGDDFAGNGGEIDGFYAYIGQA